MFQTTNQLWMATFIRRLRPFRSLLESPLKTIHLLVQSLFELVVDLPPWEIWVRQWEGWSHILRKMKHIWNHQPPFDLLMVALTSTLQPSIFGFNLQTEWLSHEVGCNPVKVLNLGTCTCPCQSEVSDETNCILDELEKSSPKVLPSKVKHSVHQSTIRGANSAISVHHDCLEASKERTSFFGTDFGTAGAWNRSMVASPCHPWFPTMWGPPVISWFRFAPVTAVISTINHSYWSYVHQLNAIQRGPHIVAIFIL